jgi:hypothetical protein
MDQLTPTNIVLALVLLEMAVRLLRSIAPKTATKADDEALAGLDVAIGWAHAAAPHLWAIVEAAAAQGAIPKAQKAAQFALMIKAEYQRQSGKALPAAAEAAAQLAAQGLSASEKLARSVPASDVPVPPLAPASR